ncbi:MAG TPA: SDR family NAD(P)-dependent oxidoreductase [Mycobacteriales bacterium]|jgi:NAD(P)-dependent dehydrogenase (short-subunit alcohol dehydrogenase family)|nr:SDR family NAD(P)-dependent oxidoreductase [Mycobacteriales bacterium]
MPKVWLITGTSRGLGRALTETVLAAGHQVLATARKPAQLTDLVDRYGAQIHPVALDVTDPAAATAAVRAAVDVFGRLDVVVNNAGYADLASVEDSSIEAFRAQIETNFYGVVHVTRAALPILREQGSGHIIQISSVGGRVTTVGLSAYQSAKWAVGGFSESLAQEVGPLGIKVTVVEPGGMRTDWAGSSMTIPPISEPYRPTVGTLLDRFADLAGIPAAEPAAAARAVVEVSELDDPPVRLLLGKDAVAFAGAVEQARAASDEKWRALSESVSVATA